MKKLLLCCAAVVCLSALAFGDNNDWPYQNPIQVTCSLDGGQQCANVINYEDGSPANAFGDFSSAGYPVTFQLETGNAITWVNYGGLYDATFGYGGTFTVQGPEGTFNGVITSASLQEDDEFQAVGINFTFDGHWSDDGKYYAGSGSSFFVIDSIDGPYAQAVLTMSTTPEPSSLLLLGSGLVGVVTFKRRLV